MIPDDDDDDDDHDHASDADVCPALPVSASTWLLV